MKTTRIVQKILSNYEGETPGVKANLARIMMTGKLGVTGKMIILPVDQGFEHGPARSFAPNPPAYDPHYHYKLAIDAGLNAYAAPLGMLEAGADTFAGQIPTILKANSANSLMSSTAGKNQAVTASVDDALRLGCAAIGFTIYPGSAERGEMYMELREIAEEAKDAGLARFVADLGAVPPEEVGGWSRDRQVAFYINAYNATVIKAVLADVYPDKSSVMDVKGFFDNSKYKVAGKTMSLNQLENDTIRPTYKDARVHFVLVCAAKSCPKLQQTALTEENLYKVMNGATRAFVRKSTTVKDGKVHTSKIFEWFKDDFSKYSKHDSVKAFLAAYHKDDVAKLLEKEETQLVFDEYDWKLNKR